MAEKYSWQEKRAYYMGLGAGKCGVEVTSDRAQEVACSLNNKSSESFLRGLLEGKAPLKHKKKTKKTR